MIGLQRARARLEEEKANDITNPEVNPDLLRLHAEMSRIINEAEIAGELGDFDLAQDLILNKLDEQNKEKAALMVCPYPSD